MPVICSRCRRASEEVRARIADEGGEPLPGTPEEQALDMEGAKWGVLVRKLGLRAE